MFHSAALRSGPPALCRRGGFTLVETLVAMGLCVLGLSVFYAAVSRCLRLVQDAREQAAVSQLIEQRFDSLRGRSFWTEVITISGLRGAIAKTSPNAGALAALSETYTVMAHAGQIAAFSVTRRDDGSITSTGASLPLSQRSVRINAALTWGAAPHPRRTRSVSTVFTKGGL